MTRPFDPRLPRRVPRTRRSLGALGALAVGTGLAIVAQATALATVLVAAAGGRLDRPAVVGFLLAVAARAGLGWLRGLVAAQAAADVKAALRGDLLAAVGRRGPGWLTGQRAGEIATLTGRGLDALDPYFTGYLPQLLLTVTVPLAVLIRLTLADWRSALIIAITLPLIPVFGALIGWQTEAATRRQWRRLSLLGGHFLDMVAGLPTLRTFGRARAQVDVVRRMADAHRVATMRTLRIAFLSALVLELVATLSIALVAVPVGLRLLAGGLTLQTALLVLLLAPEAYLPLRTAGAQFHASMEGLTALDHALTLTTPSTPTTHLPATPSKVGGPGGRVDRAISPTMGDPEPVDQTTSPNVAGPEPVHRANSTELVRLEGVTVAYERATALRDVSLTIRAGERIAVVGPSGAGKSTLLALLLGFVTPSSGRVLIDGTDLATMDVETWRRRIAWVPQRPHLFATTLRENIALGAPDASGYAVAEAARSAALDEVIADLPDGLDTRLGERGHGLSSGQRQRVALARAFLRGASLVLLDEPTARLDGGSEAAVLAATGRLLAGRTAVLVAHRPALLAGADRILRVDDGRFTELARPGAEVRTSEVSAQ